VYDSPLAESGIVGVAIGLALRGYRPVCEIQFDGFIYPAFDQIVSQLAKMRARSRGTLRLPVLEGTDVTLVAYGPTIRTALDVANIAAGEGRSVEVIDLRSLSPLDTPTLVGSAAKTGRMIVVHEAPTFAGLGAEIATAVTEQCFRLLRAPVLRVGGYNTPYPPPGSKTITSPTPTGSWTPSSTASGTELSATSP
jgi:pyruvate/2-oxoglutarate/acetoin dehydrogenase E1 component